jgi:hypothetical protein
MFCKQGFVCYYLYFVIKKVEFMKFLSSESFQNLDKKV